MKSDRRVRYTRMVLKNALIDLMYEKPIGKITVKELCEKADVNRGTFYSHYIDQFDLQKQIFDELVGGIDQIMDSSYFSANIERSGEMLTRIYGYLQDNKHIVMAMLGENCTIELQGEILAFLKGKNIFGSLLLQPDIMEYLYAFTASGCLGVVRRWLIDGKESAEEIARFVAMATTQGVLGLARKGL
ncbi:MAG: TetR/AcrR family transcriptional regulator [Clostridia bacterium]|nr:TetR/AcrR family transcriptional regulator [Clostridia bacterium]